MAGNWAPRRLRAVLSPLGATFLNRRNPYMVAWWSAAFPGFGHLLMNQYLRGIFLTLLEVGSNSMARINDALVYSFTGRFELARNTLEIRWTIGYLLIYMFAIWDSFLIARSVNKLAVLADLENAPIRSYSISPVEIQFLERKNPAVAAVLSFLFPGMGQMYNQRLDVAFYTMSWWWVFIAISNVHVSLHHLLLGQFRESKEVLNCHWLLFMPSVAGWAVYHAFVTTLERNRLFWMEQRQYLSQRYGQSDIQIMQK